MVDANGHRTSNLYDARGMVQATQDPLGALTSYTFDAVGNTVLRTDARNLPTTYTVDSLNRVTGQVYLDGTRATFTYDGDGRQVTMQDVAGVTTFQYDAAGRQTGVVNGIGKALAYSFDATGNRTVLVDPDGGRTSYSYDPQSRITGIVNPWNEATTLSYDALDREARRVLGNATAISRGYDAGGRETLISSPVAIYTATYDAVGNRTNVVELDGSRVTYSYDTSYQLTREQRSGATAIDESFAYDGLGNRLTKTDASGITTCTYNSANALVTSIAPTGVVTTSSYDANGNLTLENAAGALTTYTWDGENHLLIVANSGGTETYAYSADGMRQQKITGTGAVHYVRDGENVLIETDASLATVAQHTDLPGMWGGKYAQRRAGASRFYVPDLQGNTRALLDASASVTDTLITDAWGVELARTGTNADPFMAFGQWGYFRDTASRLYVRARHLRVDQGRWVSRDQIGFAGGDWNVYGCVSNRVTAWADPSGELGVCVAPCALCLACAVDLGLVCSDCGSDLRCWVDCIGGTISNLPSWLKWGCGLACGGCTACLIHAIIVPGQPEPDKPPKPDEPPAPGRGLCSGPYIKHLGRVVHDLCDRAGTLSCNQNTPCEAVPGIIKALLTCISAREIRDAICPPTDPDMIKREAEQMKQLWNAMRSCNIRLVKCKTGCRS